MVLFRHVFISAWRKIIALSLGVCLPLGWAQEPPAANTVVTETEVAEKGVEASGETPIEPAIKAQPIRAPSSAPRGQSPHDDASHMQLLANHLPKEGLVWVEHAPAPFVAFWQADRSGEPKGAVLILHADGANPYWQSTTQMLHNSLPDYGWATLAIALPMNKPARTAERTLPVKTLPPLESAPNDEGESAEAGQQNSTEEGAEVAETKVELDENTQQPELSQANTDVAADSEAAEAVAQTSSPPSAALVMSVEHAALVQSRLASALRFLHDNGQFNIAIMGSGANARAAQTFIGEVTPKIENPELNFQFEKPIRALILVNAYNPFGYADTALTDEFNDPDLPVLDIFYKHDARLQQAAKQRKHAARREGYKNYKQLRIDKLSPVKAWGENKISRRVRSFIEKYASGIEVEELRPN